VTEVSEFTLSGYRSLVEAFLERDYECVGFADASADQKHLILRHDIDMSIAAAAIVARLEADIGVTSTWFVLMRTEMYNPWSSVGRTVLQEISDLGHSIGLHFDASLYEEGELDSACAIECSALEQLLGQPVDLVSFHRPAAALLGADRTVGGRDHVYRPRYFQDIGYCSDSQGNWQFGHPLQSDTVRQARALQLLTHPIWWSRGLAEEPVARLESFAEERVSLLRDELAANCKPYAAAITDRKFT